MNHKNQTVGGFLRSSAVSLIILGNLFFSVIFLMSLSTHIVKQKDMSESVSDAKKEQSKTQSIVTLATIQQ